MISHQLCSSGTRIDFYMILSHTTRRVHPMLSSWRVFIELFCGHPLFFLLICCSAEIAGYCDWCFNICTVLCATSLWLVHFWKFVWLNMYFAYIVLVLNFAWSFIQNCVSTCSDHPLHQIEPLTTFLSCKPGKSWQAVTEQYVTVPHLIRDTQ